MSSRDEIVQARLEREIAEKKQKAEQAHEDLKSSMAKELAQDNSLRQGIAKDLLTIYQNQGRLPSQLNDMVSNGGSGFRMDFDD